MLYKEVASRRSSVGQASGSISLGTDSTMLTPQKRKYEDLDSGMFDDFHFEDKFHPWKNVKSLEEFRFYCCPECPSKHVNKTDFIKHAVTEHQSIIEVLDVVNREVDPLEKDHQMTKKSERRERKITEKDSPEEDPPKKKIRISTGKPTKKIQELPENIPDDKNERRKSLIFECQYCKESVSRNGKVNHEAFCFKYHKILKGNQCLICQRDFANRKAIRNHMNGVHKDVNPDNEETMNGEVLEACKTTVQDNKENIAQENPEKGDETENQEDDKEPEEPNNDSVDEDAKDDINEETDQEDELSFDNVEEVTQDNYEAFDTSEGMETKDQGDVIEDEVIEPDMTNAGEATPDDLDTSYLCATCRKTSFTDEQDFQTHECIRNEVNHNFIPMIKNHRGNTSSVGKGPELIETVYKCPICQGKLLKARQVMEHMALFHRISLENQKRMKLRICEMNIATL